MAKDDDDIIICIWQEDCNAIIVPTPDISIIENIMMKGEEST